MTNGHAKYQLHWLENNLSEDIAFHKSGVATWKEVPFARDLGVVKLRTQRLGLGITIFQWKFSLTKKALGKKIPLAQITSIHPERALTIASAFGGTIGFYDADLPEEILVGPDTELFRVTKGEQTTLHLYGRQEVELIHLGISVKHLNLLLGDTATSALFGMLNLDKAPYCHLQKTSLRIRALLYSTLREINPKKENSFSSQIKIIEYLTSLISKSTAITSREFNIRLNLATEELHHILSSIEDSRGSLVDLAKENNISPRVLDAAFKKRFELSTFAFALGKGLDDAYLEITSTETPLKVISANLGYKHVNHFSAAFKKKFGYSPSKLRK